MAGKKTRGHMEAIGRLCTQLQGLLNATAGIEKKWFDQVGQISKLPKLKEDRSALEEQNWVIYTAREKKYFEAAKKLWSGELTKKCAEIDKELKKLSAHLKTFTLPTPTGKKYVKVWRGKLNTFQKEIERRVLA